MADPAAAARLRQRAAEGFPPRPRPPLPLAISQCLLGSQVRYDGSDAGWSFPHAALSGLFEYRGICPEVGIGLGTPREPIRLVGDPSRPRVLGVKDATLDVTEPLRDYARTQAALLEDAAGYVFMRGSPSCGLFQVKVHPGPGGEAAGAPAPIGRGAYAAAVLEARPQMPVEENGRLHDPVVRESFVTRTFAYAHWQALERAGITRDRLVEFHSRYEYLLMAHSVSCHEQAGRLLSNLEVDPAEKAKAYISLLLSGLSRPASRRGHADALAHLQGHLERRLDSATRKDLDHLMRGYRRGDIPLIAPITRIKEHLGQNPEACVDQVYLDPHPGHLADGTGG